MTIVEVVLLLVGLAFILVSFFVEEKLTRKDIGRIEALSEKELNIIVERQMSQADSRIEDAVSDKITASTEEISRQLEKETNEKIMSIDEFSNTVIENMNKTHSEIVFLYSMLNDKHTELTNFVGQMQRFSENIKRTEHDALVTLEEAANRLNQKVCEHPVETKDVITTDKALPETIELSEASVAEQVQTDNHNEQILSFWKEGMSEVEIAKTLGLGLGEVRLVLGLYKEDITDAL